MQVLGPRIRSQVLEYVLDLGSRSQIQFLGPRLWSYFLMSYVLEKVKGYALDLLLDLGRTFRKISQIKVLGPRISSLVLENVLDLLGLSRSQDFCPISQVYVLGTGKCPRIRFSVLDLVLDLGPIRFMSYVLENLGPQENILDVGQVLELDPRSQVSDLVPRSQKIFLGLCLFLLGNFFSYVLVNLLDLGHRSKKYSQIQALCPKKGSRFSYKVLETSQVQGLVPRKYPRFRFQVLRFRPYVLVTRSQKNV